MVYNHYIKCQVCGSITRIRLQVGHLKQHPIVVTCGKCKTSLLGTAFFDQVNVGIKMEFENADSIDNHNLNAGDFFAECSGEFPVRKQGEDGDSNLFAISPFISQMMRMGSDTENIETYQRAIAKLNQTCEKWKYYKRVLNLYENNSPYLEQELKKEFDGPMFPSKTDPEKLHTIHMIEIIGFCSSLKPEILSDLNFSDDILRLNPVQMKALNDFLNSHDGFHLQQIQSQIYKILDEFIEIYPALIPAISLQHGNEDSFDFENKGTTTSTFETVKQFYLDVYETLGNLMVIPVAFNNIHYRSDINISDTIDSKTWTLEEFIKLTKANRYHFCTDTEKYTSFLKLKYNAKLRNAIGHNDVEYNPASQLITYYPNPKDRTIKGTEYLLQFELEALHMFQAILAVSEYLYRLRELKFMQDDDVGLIQGMAKKINLYDLCPCGSGKKYKFCHKNS